MGGEALHRYLIGLGSNRRHPRIGEPRAVIDAALGALEDRGWRVEAVSPVVSSAPVGPSPRRYANAAALIAGDRDPPETLAALQTIERAFGRRRSGLRWRARVIDLDIVLWSGGLWVSPALTIPHPQFRERGFVLAPAAAIAPTWRDPLSGLTLRQLSARNRRGLTATAGLPR